MKSEYLIKKQISAIHRQMKRNTPGQAFSMMIQVVNALEWVLDNGNEPSRVLADLANFEGSLTGSNPTKN
jgi:hypothetical protein